MVPRLALRACPPLSFCTLLLQQNGERDFTVFFAQGVPPSQPTQQFSTAFPHPSFMLQTPLKCVFLFQTTEQCAVRCMALSHSSLLALRRRRRGHPLAPRRQAHTLPRRPLRGRRF